MGDYPVVILQAFILFPIVAFLFTLPYVVFNYHKYGSVLSLRIIIVYSFILYLMCIYFLVILPLPSIAESLETQNLPLELYVGHRAVYFRYAVYTAPIHILVREMIQQVPEGTDSQLLLQNFSPVRSHTWEKLDVAR